MNTNDQVSQGAVYRATNTRLKRVVALKLLPGDLLHDVQAERKTPSPPVIAPRGQGE